MLADTTLIPREVAPFHHPGEKSGLAPFLSSDVRLHDQIDARKKEAVQKQFASKARLIIDAFGQDERYLDQDFDITTNRPENARRKEATLIKYNWGGEWRLVFESLFSPKEEHEHKEGVYIVPQADGSSKVEEKWSFSTTPESLEILAYVPGEWETHLDSLASLAEKKKNDIVHRGNVLTKKQALDEQKIRFGLD